MFMLMSDVMFQLILPYSSIVRQDQAEEEGGEKNDVDDDDDDDIDDIDYDKDDDDDDSDDDDVDYDKDNDENNDNEVGSKGNVVARVKTWFAADADLGRHREGRSYRAVASIQCLITVDLMAL